MRNGSAIVMLKLNILKVVHVLCRAIIKSETHTLARLIPKAGKSEGKRKSSIPFSPVIILIAQIKVHVVIAIVIIKIIFNDLPDRIVYSCMRNIEGGLFSLYRPGHYK